MQYYISDSGEQTGPFTIEQLRSMWAAGTITGHTSYREKGLTDWLQLSAMADELEPDRASSPIMTHSPTLQHHGSGGLNQLLALIGSVLLFAGVFCPLINVPIFGPVNYFQSDREGSTIVLVLAGGSVVLAAFKRFSPLWITGGGSLSTILFTFIRFLSAIRDAQKTMETDLHTNPLAGLTQTAIQSVQIQWGLAILALGALLLITAAALPTPSSRSR